MVMTILEARVPQDKWTTLEQTYRAAVETLDPGLVETFLLQSNSDAELWQIATLWASREALDQMRQSPEPPRGVQIFRAAGAEPKLSVLKVVVRS
jgi:heme-degrading monooxygenase HmoA